MDRYEFAEWIVALPEDERARTIACFRRMEAMMVRWFRAVDRCGTIGMLVAGVVFLIASGISCSTIEHHSVGGAFGDTGIGMFFDGCNSLAESLLAMGIGVVCALIAGVVARIMMAQMWLKHRCRAAFVSELETTFADDATSRTTLLRVMAQDERIRTFVRENLRIVLA